MPRKTFALLNFCASFLTFLPGVRYSVLFHKNFWCVWKLSPHVDYPVLLTVVFFLLHLTERVQRIRSIFARVWLDVVSQIAPLLLQPDVPLCLWLLWEQSCKMPYFPSVPMYVQVFSSREVASANQNLLNSAEWTTNWPTGVKCRATPWLKMPMIVRYCVRGNREMVTSNHTCSMDWKFIVNTPPHKICNRQKNMLTSHHTCCIPFCESHIATPRVPQGCQ